MIYRVDPATGKSSVFFDLNTVISQIDPNANTPGAGNSLGAQTGLVNWYDITFDPEGYFDGKPSMFVSSVDSADPAKNAIYRIAPDGTLLGVFAEFTDNSISSAKLTFNPSAILIPPTQQQTFLRGLLASSGSAGITVANGGNGDPTTTVTTAGTPITVGNVPVTTPGTTTINATQFAALYFDSNQYTPGVPVSSATNFPNGVKQTGLTYGVETGLTGANSNYASLVYDTFADFGTPAFPPTTGNPFPAQPGYSGVQGLGGDLLINLGNNPNQLAATQLAPVANVDLYPVISTDFRRFDDVAFDQYGYFSQGLPATPGTTTTTAATTGTNTSANGLSNGGSTLGATGGGTGNGNFGGFTFGSPVYAGSLFVADLASGLSVAVPIPAPATGTAPTPAPIRCSSRSRARARSSSGTRSAASTAPRSSRRPPGRPRGQPTRTAR